MNALEGIIDLTNDAYHAETDHWSSSYLKKQLPERYKAFSRNTEAMQFGTLFHTLLLEPEMAAVYVSADAEEIGVKADGSRADNPMMTKAWKDYVAAQEANGRIIVAQGDMDRARRMVDAVYAHPAATELLAMERNVEESVFVTDEEGNRLKARFDIRVEGGIVDVKTTSAKPGSDSLARAVIDFGYDLSAAHYLDVARLAELGVDRFTLLFVSKDDIPRVTVAELDHRFLVRGRALRDLAIDRLRNVEPPYEGADHALSLTPPPWALHGLTTASAGIPADFVWSLDDYS